MKNKILNLKDFLPIRKKIESEKKKLVFTNGCFDLIHRGHVEYLSRARELGDYLVVGLNSDDSVRRIKGKDRPIVPLEDRAIVLSALESVDFVIPFEEDTPERIIGKILPDKLVKGEDWAKNSIVGADIVSENGGEVVRIPLTAGKSTSELIKRILKLHGGD